jgi:hypothetical protein
LKVLYFKLYASFLYDLFFHKNYKFYYIRLENILMIYGYWHKRPLELQYFLRSFRGTGTWAKCWSRHKTDTDCQKTSPYRPNKGHDKHFSVPVLDQSVSISASLVPGPALCPGACAADRPQEILYFENVTFLRILPKLF